MSVSDKEIGLNQVIGRLYYINNDKAFLFSSFEGSHSSSVETMVSSNGIPRFIWYRPINSYEYYTYGFNGFFCMIVSQKEEAGIIQCVRPL